VDAAALMIYKSKAMFDGKDDEKNKGKPEYQALDPGNEISGIEGGKTSKTPLYVDYEERAAPLSSSQALEWQEKGLLYQSVLQNKKVGAFSSAPGEGKTKRSAAPCTRKKVWDYYGRKCAFCGNCDPEVQLSCAHVADHDKNFNTSRKGKTFRDPFDLRSERNFILLCTNFAGSCHAQFDAFNLALVPAKLNLSHHVICFKQGWHKYEECIKAGPVKQMHEDVKCIQASFDFKPTSVYRRVLGERLEHSLVSHRCIDNLTLFRTCSTIAELSVCQSDVEDERPPKRSRTSAVTHSASSALTASAENS